MKVEILGSEVFRFEPASTFFEDPLGLDYCNVSSVDVVRFYQLVEDDEGRLCSKEDRRRVKLDCYHRVSSIHKTIN